MKYGILADIHSNLEAFQAVLAFLKKNRVEVMVIAGDVLGYGASPLECLQLLAGEQSVACVRGNHEEALLSGEFSRMRPEAVTSLIWTRQQLNRFWIDYLASFPFIICGANFALCHGAADRPLSGYLTSRDRAKRAFAARLHRICFCGHTHFP
ncbi:MAG TPA: metallophosphoesterase family protein, partial [bacterium]|nr:metallophosphoesterase family protein [bacterium]